MPQNFRPSQGDIAISWASHVIAVFHEKSDLSFSELIDYWGIKYLDKIGKPCKKTVLHDYIECIMMDNYSYLIRKGFPAEVISDLYVAIQFYNIDITRLGEYKFFHISDSDLLIGNYEDYEDAEIYADKLLDLFETELLELIADDVFTILYSNKTFLHDFNVAFSDIVSTLKISDYPELLKEDGVIKRCDYLPSWLKDGVFFRDKGRCQICGCDLTRLLQLDNKVNLDHIVPLQRGGTNDPINFQITCEHCNKSKQDRDTRSTNLITPFWLLTASE